MPNDLAPPKRTCEVVTCDRYSAVKHTFGDACLRAEAGPKYNLDDEIALVRSYLAKIVEELEAGKSNLSAKAFSEVCRNLRETLKQAAEFDGLIPVTRLRDWAAEFIGIVREEIKDDIVIERIKRRAARLAI